MVYKDLERPVMLKSLGFVCRGNLDDGYLRSNMKDSFKIAILLLGLALFPFLPVSAETLATIDAEIQNGNTTLTRIAGQAAYNVYSDVTGNPNSFLDRKIAILQAAGITNFASSGNYSNFYSFTGQAGVTDTKIDIITTTSTTRLYRRGNSSRLETQSYLGSWWSGSYLGTAATRNGQAVLAAWGSDLQRIYVIDVPAGTTLVGGLAAPMEQAGEYRSGGAYQYYYRGVPASWLVYALYAPDYLQSYAAAVSGAQRLGENGLEDLGTHIDEVRYRVLQNRGIDANGLRQEETQTKTNKGKDNNTTGKLMNPWLRIYGGDSRLNNSGEDMERNFNGIHLGWEKLVRGEGDNEKDYWHIGGLIGQSFMKQNSRSNVKNDITHNYAGIYSVFQSRPDQLCSWYNSAGILYGHMQFANQVPGELGYGLNQTYSGNMLATSVEHGLTFRRSNGWYIEPQIQMVYTKVLQDTFTDKLGANVRVRRGDSLAGRLGVAIVRQSKTKAGRETKFWVKANYLRELRGQNKVDVAGDEAFHDKSDSVFQLKVGTHFVSSQKFVFSGEISKDFGQEHGYQGSLSLQSFF